MILLKFLLGNGGQNDVPILAQRFRKGLQT